MHHFGNPLVATPDDFGMRSDEPTHSKLLDWLAASFIDSGWSIKWLHREILLSSVFRQASENESDASTLDPENNLLGRMNRRRLDFEATRDALLNVSGSLVRRIGGPSSDVLASRRTVYTRIDRDSIPGLLCTFDFPDPQTFSARRVDTTVAPQALFFMNHPFVIDRAKEVLRREGIADAPTIDVKIDRLYALLFQRRASADERDMGRAFLTAPRNQNPLYTTYGRVHALSPLAPPCIWKHAGVNRTLRPAPRWSGDGRPASTERFASLALSINPRARKPKRRSSRMACARA